MSRSRWTTALALALTASAAITAWAQAPHRGHEHSGGEARPPRPAPAPATDRKSTRITMEELHHAGGVPPGWKFSLPAVGPGHTGPDGRSIMPDFTDSLTVSELVNLVAYVKSLTGNGDHQHHGAAAPARERVAGDYRIRVEYQAHGGGHRHGRQPGHQHGGGQGPAPSHLMVFVSDLATGEPVPCLPVTATIQAGKTQPRIVKLSPMVGGEGFDYGADVTLPEPTTTVTLAIGRPMMRVMPSAAGRFARPVTVSFDWAR